MVSRPLTRTARTVRPQSCSRSAAIAVARAAAFMFGAHASSRSKKTRSAPADGAFAHILSLLAGVASSERRALGAVAVTSDDTARPQIGEPLDTDADEVVPHRVVVGSE